MTVRVSGPVRRRVRLAAADHDLSQTDALGLLVLFGLAALRQYEKREGATTQSMIQQVVGVARDEGWSEQEINHALDLLAPPTVQTSEVEQTSDKGSNISST
jgi:hypothetical protein